MFNILSLCLNNIENIKKRSSLRNDQDLLMSEILVSTTTSTLTEHLNKGVLQDALIGFEKMLSILFYCIISAVEMTVHNCW